MRYWIDGEEPCGAGPASGFKSEGVVIAFSSESHFLDLFFF